jgi:hypothetical protein
VFERFTDRARRVLRLAQDEARLLEHPFIGTEHILLGLVHEGEGVAAQVLESQGIALTAVREKVKETIGIVEGGARGQPPFTPRAKKVLELSLREALALDHSYIGTEHLLLGVLRGGEGVATQVLVGLGADPVRMRQMVMEFVTRGPADVTKRGGGRWRRSGLGRPLDFSPVPQEAPPPLADVCALCGRHLWDVAHFFGAEDARVCDECIRAAARVLDSAASEQRELALPPRVFGNVPDEGSVDELVDLVRAVVGPGADANRRAAAVEEGEALDQRLRALDEQVTGWSRVSRVRFLAPDSAELRFHFRVIGEDGEIAVGGRAQRTDGRWLLTRVSALEVLARAGVRSPQRPAEDDG